MYNFRVCFLFFANRGEEYNQHTKCISEEEKYSGKNYVPKAGANKGEQKQNQWVEVCVSIYAIISVFVHEASNIPVQYTTQFFSEL